MGLASESGIFFWGRTTTPTNFFVPALSCSLYLLRALPPVRTSRAVLGNRTCLNLAVFANAVASQAHVKNCVLPVRVLPAVHGASQLFSTAISRTYKGKKTRRTLGSVISAIRSTEDARIRQGAQRLISRAHAIAFMRPAASASIRLDLLDAGPWPWPPRACWKHADASYGGNYCLPTDDDA